MSDSGDVTKWANPFWGGSAEAGEKAGEELVASIVPEMPEMPEVPEAPPDRSDESVQDAADRARRRYSAGRASTVLTGGLGVVEDAPVARKTLLGA